MSRLFYALRQFVRGFSSGYRAERIVRLRTEPQVSRRTAALIMVGFVLVLLVFLFMGEKLAGNASSAAQVWRDLGRVGQLLAYAAIGYGFWWGVKRRR